MCNPVIIDYFLKIKKISELPLLGSPMSTSQRSVKLGKDSAFLYSTWFCLEKINPCLIKINLPFK